ncbi:transglutaminase domain-containing protein [Paenibacillus senegalimassiliensis]|uniref:transglutaminase domain-containing protein n=1 Tax=Paenibacillus senegalimassiliensis TaxID=1737426 RepID=UPI00073F18F2|nr:transglutaminase domain-containing protein [Paenibacillus senegalimassiliensis]
MGKDTRVLSLDERELKQIAHRFEQKRKLGQGRDNELFGVFEEEALTEEEGWALKFLYAYMPACDMAEYDGALFLSHVRQALTVRKQVPWGERVPDSLFLHFVLPYRVNTENIEDFRQTMYRELAPRMAGLSMEEAILEVNYWCHEQATYIGSDLRTLSPLSMIRSARGRCGEESTLAVAALRSIGIPARQCYTPRWAHCDDNHAWVEAWADGHWHYIGACEPEARLDQGWFTGPARRAMLVHSRVASTYPGPEEVTVQGESHAELNLMGNYAPTRTVKVQVVDLAGAPAPDIPVMFQLYNYAELSTIASIDTNSQGEVRFTTGYGDLWIRAVGSEGFGQIQAKVSEGDYFQVVLNQGHICQPDGTEDFEMVPPPETEPSVGEVAPQVIRQHEERVAAGAAQRLAYEGTFPDERAAGQLAAELGLDSSRVWRLLQAARGNHQEITAFLKDRVPQHGEWPLLLLESLRDKDMIDTRCETLEDHLQASLLWSQVYEKSLFVTYILCPRVLFEMIGPYKEQFQSAFTAEEQDLYRADPAQLANLLSREWQILEELPHLRGKAGPLGIFKLRAGDRTSLEILFVALCRSLGIPARLHPSEQKPQYYTGEAWRTVRIGEAGGEEQASPIQSGKLWLHLEENEQSDELAAASYGENFTLARLEQGIYKTLLYPHGKQDVYDVPFELEPGAYRLTSGVRLKDGTVFGRWTYFQIITGAETNVTLTFPVPPQPIPMYGQADLASPLRLANGSPTTVEEMYSHKQALLIAWLEPDREPSRHLLRETFALTEQIIERGVPVVFAVAEAEEGTMGASPFQESDLPQGTTLVYDREQQTLSQLMTASGSSSPGKFPHVFVLDGAGQIRYRESGYKPGSGKEALQVLSKLEDQRE